MRIDAAITKAEIELAVSAYDTANAVRIFDKQPGAVVLVTFAGALNLNTGLYEGAYLFRDAKPADANLPRVDFLDALPGIPREE